MESLWLLKPEEQLFWGGGLLGFSFFSGKDEARNPIHLIVCSSPHKIKWEKYTEEKKRIK